jgi:hypothetical protein
MTIKVIHNTKRDIGQTLIVNNKLEYEFAKLNFNKCVKIIIKKRYNSYEDTDENF